MNSLQDKRLGLIFCKLLHRIADKDILPFELPANYKDTIKGMLNNALSENPDDPRLQKLAAYFRIEDSDFASALPLLKSSAREIKNLTWTHKYNLGLCSYKMKLYEDALPHLMACATIYPGDVDLHFMTGYALHRTGKKAQALPYLKRSRHQLEKESQQEFVSELHTLARAGLTKAALQPSPQ